MKLPDQPSLDHQSVVNTQRPSAKTGSSFSGRFVSDVYTSVAVAGVCVCGMRCFVFLRKGLQFNLEQGLRKHSSSESKHPFSYFLDCSTR